MKIEQGKYYCTADGKKVGPMKPSGFDDWPWIVTSGNGICWRDDGCPVTSGSPRLVAEWTDDPKLWRDMTPEEKGALLLAHHEGKRIQIYRALDKMWEFIKSPCWSECHAYCVRPEPVRETVTLYGAGYEWGQAEKPCYYDTHCITYDLEDGEPDCASVRMQKL